MLPGGITSMRGRHPGAAVSRNMTLSCFTVGDWTGHYSML